MAEYLSRKQVFFKCHNVCLGIVIQDGIDKGTDACRGFKHLSGDNLMLFQHIRQSLRNG